MSYLIKSLAYNVSKFTHGTLRSRNNLLLRNNPYVACFAYCNIQTRVKRYEENTSDQHLQKLDFDARRLGRLSYNDVKAAFEIIKAKRAASVTQSLLIIRCCGNLLIEELPEKRTKLVQEMWHTLESLGVNLDIGHYNALLRVYLENEYDFKPSDILADLEKRGLEPNRVTYLRLIARYCQMGDMTGATRIIEFMREKEVPVNETIFNTLIMGHSQSNDMVSAENILNVMKQANIEPSGETYAQLVSGYIKQGDVEKAMNILHDCESRDVLFTDKEYFDIIFSLAKHGFEKEVEQILPKLRRVPGYNQDAINSIYRLLNIGITDASFKILKTMARSTRPDGVVLPIGSFFISHLVRSDFPAETIAKYCQELMKENQNPYALSIALEKSLRLQKENSALFLMKKAKEAGMTIRPHYFWPLIILHGKNKNKAALFNILYTMQKDFDTPINTETLREYVVPYLLTKGSNLESLLMDLKASGCSVAASISSIVYHYLMANDIQSAASVAETYSAFYAPFVFRRPLVNAFINSGDIQSFVKLVRAICVGAHWRATSELEKADEDEEQTVHDYRENAGTLIKDVLIELQKDLQFPQKFQLLLKEMLTQGLGLTSNDAHQIQQNLQTQLTLEISELLEKLTSEELAVAPSRTRGSRISMASLDENSLERLLETMKANSEPLASVQKQLYTVYARNKNLEKLLKLKEEMDADNFVYTTGMKAVLIDAYVEGNKLDEAIQLYDAVCQEMPEFNLHPVKLLRFALLLVENDKIEKAVEILNKKQMESETPEIVDELNFKKSSLCWRILNFFAEKGDVTRVTEFFNLFIERELVEVNNILLGPLIKVHMKRDDIDEAMKTFEMCCERYRCTPWKNELTRYFVEKEDAVNLQRLTDLSTPIHGEVNSLYDLMLSFLECGRVRQAKKILETPGLRVRHDRIHNACNKYLNEGAVEHLENLLVVTKDISSVNRSEMYLSMLQTQEYGSDPKKALGLWMQMQEEDVQPSEHFFCLLADILKRHNMEVPFTVPTTDIDYSNTKPQQDKIPVSRNSQSLRKLLNDGNVDQAIVLKQKIGANKFNKTDWSLLIAGCCHQNRYKDAVQLLNEYYDHSYQLPHARHFKVVLQKAAENGDIDLFNVWKDRVPDAMKKATSFESTRVKAYMSADKIDDYLNELEEKSNRVKSDDDFQAFKNAFPKGGLMAILDSKPEYLPRVQAITKKLEEKGFDSLSFDNFWWIFFMKTNQIDAARKLWNEKLKHNTNRVIFGSLTTHIHRTRDVELGKVFLDMVRSKNGVSPGVLGVVYGTLISALTQRNEINEALQYLTEAVEKFQVPPSLIIRFSLVLLKSACDAKNIPFPFDIPVTSQRLGRIQHEDNSDGVSD